MPHALPLPTIIDIEASGFGRGSYPIEVGFILPDGSSFCTLIRPEADWQHWDDNAERIHGVERSVLQVHGKPVGEVCQEINRRLHGQSVYSDGWSHDYSWLGRLFDAAGSFPVFHLKDLRELLGPCEQALWHATRDETETRLNMRRHRASTDARILQETLRVTRLQCAMQPAQLD